MQRWAPRRGLDTAAALTQLRGCVCHVPTPPPPLGPATQPPRAPLNGPSEGRRPPAPPTHAAGAGLGFRPAIQAMGPHVAPLGIRFYKRNSAAPFAFPPEYDLAALIALHGSWDKFNPIGAK